MNAVVIHVAQEAWGGIRTVTEALKYAEAYAGKPVVIRIGKGIYKEKIEIRQNQLTLSGESEESVILTYDDFGNDTMPDGERRGTFRSYSVLVDANDFTARNITFENSAGAGTVAGQALALYVDGDRIMFDHCRMTGSQDTLFTGPLPREELVKGGFKGPKEWDERKDGRHYYRNCYICGDVDFIFGSATAYFEQCEIFSINRDKPVGGYITAASTPKGNTFGYVFNHCRFTGSCRPDSVYFGRPWRDYAKVVIMNSEIGSHIKKEGWHNWNKPQAEQTSFYAEYNNFGEGADTSGRVPWSVILTEKEAEKYSINKVLGDWICELDPREDTNY